MTLGFLGCAVGRHRPDMDKQSRIHGMAVTRCRHCRSPLEMAMPGRWRPQQVHSAGLGYREIL